MPTASRLLVLAWFLLLASPPPGAQPAPETPAISLIYAGLLETHCASMMKVPPNADAIREARTRAAEFQQLWDREGPPILQAVVRHAGQPFRFREAAAALHMCPGLPSGTSMPLALNLSRFLHATTNGAPEPLHRFTPIVVHEILHRYVMDSMRAITGADDPFAGTTPLLTKYAKESYPVRGHLHLMAIEEIVYQKLGMNAVLADIRAHDATYPNYHRARTIVREEGAARLLAEWTRHVK